MAGGPAAPSEGIGANAPKNKWAGILMTAFAAFGGILFGYDTGTISGIIAMDDWLRTFGVPTDATALGFHLTSSRKSLVVSILSAGTFFGALLGTPAADHPGRRIGIVASCLVFSLSVALQTGAPNFATFAVGKAADSL